MRERFQDQLIGWGRAVVRLLDRGLIPLAIAVFAGFTAFASWRLISLQPGQAVGPVLFDLGVGVFGLSIGAFMVFTLVRNARIRDRLEREEFERQ